MPSNLLTIDNRLPVPRNRYKILFFVMLAALILGGCATNDGKSSRGAFDGRDISNARKVEVKNNINIDDLRDVSEADSETDSQQSVRSSGIKTTDGQLLGFKTKILFSESLSNEADRFDRLENAVQDIRDEFDKMSPSINRLVSIESDIRELHDQLKVLINNGSLGRGGKSKGPPPKKALDESDLQDIEPIEEGDLHKEVEGEFLPSLPIRIGDVLPEKPAAE